VIFLQIHAAGDTPLENCGKTTTLKVIEQLAHEPSRCGSSTSASVYRKLERTPGQTLIMDEIDNAGLNDDGKMRAIYNYGYENGTIERCIGGCVQEFNVGAPLALGTIGPLPRPLMSRSIAINMRRSPINLKRFDDTDPAFMIAREAIEKWAARCNLSRDPEMPAGFHGRKADNWRPLLSIAADLGYSEQAHAAATTLGLDRQYENPNITLLADIRAVFNQLETDRLVTKTDLIPGLTGLEDNLWAEWTGIDDTASPHRLTPGDIGRLLRPFGIRSKNIWPPRRNAGSKSQSGYYRDQFEQVWTDYCEMGATPPQASKIKLIP
jgi:Protein of unknown function (DUF3631)